MATERLNIQVTESGASVVAKTIRDLADAIGDSGTALNHLRTAIKEMKSGDVTRNLNAMSTKIKAMGTHGRTAAEALTKLNNKVERLDTSMDKFSASSDNALQRMSALRRQLGGAGTAGTKAAVGISAAGRAASGAAPRFDAATKQLFVLRTTMATFGGIALAKGFLGLSDTFQNLTNRVRLVTNGTQDLIATRSKLFAIAKETRQDAEATIETYVRLKKATAEYGTSAEDIQGVLTTINKMMAISGASATESSQAIRQLSQAFSKGKLDGDEFRSVSENMPDILDALSQSLGVSRGALRQMAENGQLTSNVLLTAFREVSDEVDQKFASSAQTLGQAWQGVKNSALEAVGAINEGLNPIGVLISTMNVLAENFWLVTTAVQVLTFWLAVKLARALKDVGTRMLETAVGGANKLFTEISKINKVASMKGLGMGARSLNLFRGAIGSTVGRLGLFGLATAGLVKGLGAFTDAINAPIHGIADLEKKYASANSELEKTPVVTQHYEEFGRVIDDTNTKLGEFRATIMSFSQDQGVEASKAVLDKFWASATGKESWAELDKTRQEMNRVFEELEKNRADVAAGRSFGQTGVEFAEQVELVDQLSLRYVVLKGRVSELEEAHDAAFKSFRGGDATDAANAMLSELLGGYKKLEVQQDAINKNYDEQIAKLVLLQQSAEGGLDFALFGKIQSVLENQRDEALKALDPEEKILGSLKRKLAALEDTTGEIEMQNRRLEAQQAILKDLGDGIITEKPVDWLDNMVTKYLDLEDSIEAVKKAQKDAEKAEKDAEKEREQRMKERQRAAKAFANELANLQNSLNPVLAAERKMAEAEHTITVARKRGMITTAEAIDMNERLARSMKDSLDPLSVSIRELAEETASYAAESDDATEFMKLKTSVSQDLNRELGWLEEKMLGVAFAATRMAEKTRESKDALKEEVDELIGGGSAMGEYMRALEVAAAARKDPRSIGQEQAIQDFVNEAYLKTQSDAVQGLLGKLDKVAAKERSIEEMRKLAHEAAMVRAAMDGLTIEETIALREKLFKIQKDIADKAAKSAQQEQDRLEAARPKGALESLKEQYLTQDKLTQQWASTFISAYDSMQDRMVEFFMGAEIGWKGMVDSILADLTRLLTNKAIAGLISGNGGSAMGGAGILGGMFAIKGIAGAQHGANWHVGADIPKFAHGGDFTVGGAGGPDTKLVQFMASPGERVSVTSPGQTRMDAHKSKQAPTEPPVFQINNFVDPNSFGQAMASPAGSKATANAVRMRPDVLKRYLR